MNDTQLLPDDPRITAYALGELEGDERAAVEQALRQNPTLRLTVDEIRATAEQLEAALAEESAETEARGVEETGRRGSAEAARRANDPYPVERKGTLLSFPQVYFVVGGLAAACFALVAALRTPPPPAPAKIELAEAKTYVDMNLLVPARETVAVAAPAVDKAPESTPPAALSEKMANLPAEGQAEAVAARALASAPAVSAPTKDLSLLGQTRVAAPTQPFAQPSGTLALSGVPVAPVAAAKPDSRAETVTSGVLAGARIENGVMTLSPFMVSAERVQTGSSGASVSQANVQPARFAGGATRGMVGKGFVATAPTFGPVRSRLPADAQFATNTENYSHTPDNGFVSVAQNAFSTFSVDTDTASYANIRRMLRAHQRPPRDAVRIEELLNYFPYRYAVPTAKSEAPFAASLEVADAPWAPTHRLVRIGLKGREVSTVERPAANLVFLLDVSGSMNAPNRLPLVKESMRLLIGKLRADDRVAIVTYAGQSGLALPSTPVSRASEILAALDSLSPGGSTNGSMGIQLAYDIAKANRVEGGINRVILCTDGDFNVGVTSEGELVRLIQDKAQSGVFLTVLGYGMGNLKDSTLEKLADKGNGSYGYIDSRREAEKLLVQQVSGTLVTIAKDVKLQVEFNPSQVASYRLIGYENRLLKKEDFADDKVDAGEIGAGHTVTALYEVIPVSVAAKAGTKEPEVEERRYQVYAGVSGDNTLPGRIDPRSKEMLLVKVRYKKPDGNSSARVDFPLVDSGARFAAASPDFKFAAAVAGFGMILRESPHKGTATMASVAEWAEAGSAEDPGGYRSEFIELARNAEWVEQR